ncbi:MAG: hypothetical protein QOE61_4189 [Micromonosporaceae bacterium]|jgi:hypothetical protein|nr:hypothetical protein [Micromonosporaceae bacterium]
MRPKLGIPDTSTPSKEAPDMTTDELVIRWLLALAGAATVVIALVLKLT